MNIWIASSLVFIVLSLYLFVTDIFSFAFRLTGMAEDRVRFQVASLFTGCGFTTLEAEIITTNKTRRRLATACMYTGHIFTALVIGLVMNLFINISNQENSVGSYILFGLSLTMFVMLAITKIPPINRRLQDLLSRLATKIGMLNY